MIPPAPSGHPDTRPLTPPTALPFPAEAIGTVYRTVNQLDRQIIVASVPTLAQKERLAQLPRTFESVFVDEAHHCTATTYRRILNTLNVDTPQGPWLLGVTATPERADRIPLTEVFDEIVYAKDLKAYIDAGILCPLSVLQIQSEDPALSLEMGEVCLDTAAPRTIVRAHQQHAADRQRTLVFAPTIQNGDAIVHAFREAGYAAEAIHGAMPLSRRRAIRAAFHDGRVTVLVNCQVFTEGVDEPLIDCLVLARRTFSKSLYLQMLGRGIRPAPSKKDCLVLDCIGLTTTHSPLTASQLFDMPVDVPLPSIRSRQHSSSQDDFLETHHLSAKRINLFATRALVWKEFDGAHLLNLGRNGYLVIHHLGDQYWSLSHRTSSHTETVLAKFVSFQEAKTRAHRFAMTHGFTPAPPFVAEWKLRQMAAGDLVISKRGLVLTVPPLRTRTSLPHLSSHSPYAWVTTQSAATLT